MLNDRANRLADKGFRWQTVGLGHCGIDVRSTEFPVVSDNLIRRILDDRPKLLLLGVEQSLGPLAFGVLRVQ
jgi:hypothetical protein